MNSLFIYSFVVIVILWSIAKPWNRSWFQLILYGSSCATIPIYIIWKDSENILERMISMVAVFLFIVLLLLSLRSGQFDFNRLIKVNNKESGIELDSAKKSRYKKIIDFSLYLFYAVCLVYFVLYKK